MKFKHVIVLIVIASFASILYGFSLKSDNEFLANRFIGSGTVGLFLIAMPLFLYKESKGKRMKDYMLTKENIEKMQKKESQNTENQ
jgi:cyanate permease